MKILLIIYQCGKITDGLGKFWGKFFNCHFHYFFSFFWGGGEGGGSVLQKELKSIIYQLLFIVNFIFCYC